MKLLGASSGTRAPSAAPRLFRRAGTGPGRRGIARARIAMAPSSAFGPNMTPMVDVVMVILVFFMAGMAFVAPELFISTGIASTRERGEGAAVERDPFELPPVTFTITLRRDGAVTLVDGAGMDGVGVDAVEAAVRELLGRGELGVLIAPASDVPIEDVVFVQGACARAGVERMALQVD